MTNLDLTPTVPRNTTLSPPSVVALQRPVVAYLVEWAVDSTFSDGWSSTVSLLSGGAPFHKASAHASPCCSAYVTVRYLLCERQQTPPAHPLTSYSRNFTSNTLVKSQWRRNSLHLAFRTLCITSARQAHTSHGLLPHTDCR